MKKQLSSDEVQKVISKLEINLKDLKTRWDQENPKSNWWIIPRNYLLRSTIFIFGSLDELITFVEGEIPDGSDKKEAVMAVVGKLFDYIVIQAFPFWLRPFSKTIKDIVIGIIVSKLIDFIVAKYNAGYWNMQEAPNGTTNQTT